MLKTYYEAVDARSKEIFCETAFEIYCLPKAITQRVWGDNKNVDRCNAICIEATGISG